MLTAISRFRVRNGMEGEVRSAFVNRPRLVEGAAGFCGLDVIQDASDPAVFLLLTRWADEESFRTWHRSEAHHQSHALMPHGLKLDAAFTSLTIGKSVEDPGGIQHLSDALEGQTVSLSRWLLDSNDVCALLLAPDGSIRVRNQAAHRIFPADPSKNFGTIVWDYLVHSDAEHLRRRMSASHDQNAGSLLLNRTDGMQSPITLVAWLVPCSGGLLLLATEETRHDSHVHTDVLKLTNELTVMMRESARKNRELKEANDTIARLARTDALTGLANRRTLDETLPREIARAERQGKPLAVIMADLDHFKAINDRFGHVIGDQVLAGAAAVFGSNLRAYDLAARYGGEEFVLVLPGTTAKEAAPVAQRVRKEVADIKIPNGPTQITISLGIASFRTGETPDQIVARADAALYRAKNAGRNRVEIDYIGQA